MSDYSQKILHQAWDVFAGKELGRGMSRVVYTCLTNPKYVLKVEDYAKNFQNIIEWETWSRAKEIGVDKWLAPCIDISPDGSVLVMARTLPTDRHPPKMPAFLCDFKRQNYGAYEGRIVCHDYGTNLALYRGMESKLMRKADWYTE